MPSVFSCFKIFMLAMKMKSILESVHLGAVWKIAAEAESKTSALNIPLATQVALNRREREIKRHKDREIERQREETLDNEHFEEAYKKLHFQ